MAERPRLRELAERVGIVASYRASGGERRVTSDATREALLVAMGFECGQRSRGGEDPGRDA